MHGVTIEQGKMSALTMVFLGLACVFFLEGVFWGQLQPLDTFIPLHYWYMFWSHRNRFQIRQYLVRFPVREDLKQKTHSNFVASYRSIISTELDV